MANIVKEDDVEKLVEGGHLTPVNTPPPALPSNFAALTNPYPAGSLPLTLQYESDLLNTQFRGGAVPTIRLMPIQAAGQPSVNSANENAVGPVKKIAAQAQTTATGAQASADTASATATTAQATAVTAQSTATTAQSTATTAQSTATTAQSGVATLNSQTAVTILGSSLVMAELGSLGTSTFPVSLDNLDDGASFARVTVNALTANQIDSTQPGFLAAGGSTVPQIVGTVPAIFSYTSTTTTVDIFLVQLYNIFRK